MKLTSENMNIARMGLCLSLSSLLALPMAQAQAGFTEPHVTLYGKVRQQDGGLASVMRAGEIELRLRRADQPENEVRVKGTLKAIGEFSYAIKVPLKYLPAEYQMASHLSVDAGEKSFEIVEVSINDEVATLEDGSREFLPLSMADRGSEVRLDLAIATPFTDSDGDGLADDWEERFDLVVGVADQNTDNDLDGWTALEEFFAGTNPTVDNRPVTLSAGQTEIPEKGLAGLYLDIIDSNSPADQIQVTLEASALVGVGELRLNGELVDLEVPLSVTAADIRAGRLAVRQLAPWSDGLSLGVSLQDPDRTEAVTGSQELVTGYLVEPGRLDASLWLDAASLSGDGSLASWADRSGHDQAVMQANAAYQPALGVHKNGLKTVDFSGEQSHLFLPADLFAASSQTILVSADLGSSRGKKGERVFWSTADSGASLEPRMAQSSHPDALRFRHDGAEAFSWAARGGSLLTMTASGSGQVMVQSEWDASMSEVQAATEKMVFPCLGLERKLGAPLSEAAATAFDGELNEMLVFPRELAEQELRRKQNFLLSKWSGAEVWDFGTQVRPISLVVSSEATGERLVRGGWGHDVLGGTAGADVLSGGSGDDELTGGEGSDVFLFGLLDVGADVVVDFDPAADVLNFSAIFVGETGNALDVLSLDYHYGFEGTEPTVDSVISVIRPDGEPLSVTLPQQLLTEDDLAMLVVEGAINLGALSVPQTLNLVTTGSNNLVEGEDGVQFVLSRSGQGVGGRIEVPVALSVDSDESREFVIPGAMQPLGDRAMVVMERGETEVNFELKAINDGVPEGQEVWQVTPVASHRWDLDGDAVDLMVSEAEATFRLVASGETLNAELGAPVTITVERLDAGLEAMTLALEARSNLSSSAWSGLPDEVSFAAGETSQTLVVSPGEIERRGVLLVGLQGEEGVQIVSPSEVRIRLAPDSTSEPGSLFEESLAGSSETGRTAMLEHVFGTNGSTLGVVRNASGDLMLKVEAGHSVLMPRMNPNAVDVKWSFAGSESLNEWSDATGSFVAGGFDKSTGRGRFVSLDPVSVQGRMFFRSQVELLAPVSSVLASGWTGDGLEVSGVAQTGKMASSWQSRPDGSLFQDPRSGAQGSLLLNFKGDGEVRFVTGLVEQADGLVEVLVDGVVTQEYQAGEKGEIVIDVVPGLIGTVELRSLGGGVFVQELNFIANQ